MDESIRHCIDKDLTHETPLGGCGDKYVEHFFFPSRCTIGCGYLVMQYRLKCQHILRKN